MRSRLAVGAIVSGGAHEHVARGACTGHDGVERVAERASAPRVVRNLNSLRDAVVDGRDAGTQQDAAVAGSDLESCETDDPAHAHDTLAVVADRADCARGVGSVAVVVSWVIVVVVEVPTPHIVDLAVALVVDAVVGDLAGIGPAVRGQILVGGIESRFCHAVHHGRRASEDVPDEVRVDVRAGGAGIAVDYLTCIVHRPEIAEVSVVG